MAERYGRYVQRMLSGLNVKVLSKLRQWLNSRGSWMNWHERSIRRRETATRNWRQKLQQVTNSLLTCARPEDSNWKLRATESSSPWIPFSAQQQSFNSPVKMTQLPVNLNDATTGNKLRGLLKDVISITSWWKGGLFQNWEYTVLSYGFEHSMDCTYSMKSAWRSCLRLC